MGATGASIAPTGGAALCPWGSPNPDIQPGELAPPTQVRHTTHYTRHGLKNTALHACIFLCARPSQPLPFGNSAFGTPQHAPNHTTPHHTTPHHTTPHHTTPHHTTPHHTTPHHTTPHHTTPHHTTPHHTDPDQPVREANLRGITISSHVSKLEPTAFYAVATAIYERALGGPCLVGGMRGVSL